MNNQLTNEVANFSHNNGELIQYVKKCEELLESWDEDDAEELISAVSSKYKVALSPKNLTEQIHEIHVQLMFALKYF